MDIERKAEQLAPWYHRVTVTPDIETPAATKSNISLKFQLMEAYLPADLTGLRVLDLGCNAGGMSIEFAKRGATAVGIETGRKFYDQAMWLRSVLGLEAALEYRNESIYSVMSLDEKFDIVLFMGIFYHLRYPQLALDACRRVCRGRLFLNTPFIAHEADMMEMRAAKGKDRLQHVTFNEESHYNWWYPSPSALEKMLMVAGVYRNRGNLAEESGVQKLSFPCLQRKRL